MSKPLISIHQLGFSRQTAEGKERRILYDVSLELFKGQITTLIGPNGAGKTTLLKLVLGLKEPTSGAIKRKKGIKIGYVPQKIVFNTFLPLRVMDFLTLFTKNIAKIEEKLDSLKMLDKASFAMASLSGGELQKILLVQATLEAPDVLILDEPSQGMDITSQHELYPYIDAARRQTNCAVLLVSHDLHMVMATSDKVFCLNHHICCEGHPEDVRKHPEYLGLFGGAVPSTIAPYHHHHDHKHDDN